MIKTLIVDDERHCINAVEILFHQKSGYTICAVATSVKEAIALTNLHRPNLVILDIVLGDGSGFDYLNAFFPRIDFNIIFTTAFNVFAVQAFKYSALHYLLKPLQTKEFDDALLRMQDKVNNKNQLERLLSLQYNYKAENVYRFIHLSSLDNFEKIYSKDIIFLKADNNYTTFYLSNGKKRTISKTMKFYSELLKSSHFYRISKSCIVNVEKIKTYNKKTYQLILQNGTIVKVAVRRHSQFIKTVFKSGAA